MKRACRHIYTLLALGFVALDLRSASSWDVFAAFLRPGDVAAAATDRGRLLVLVGHIPGQSSRAWSVATTATDALAIAALEREFDGASRLTIGGSSLGIGGTGTGAFGHADQWFLRINAPLWALATLAAVPLAGRVLRQRGTLVRSRLGLCFKCGYDLRASGDRCPECGEAKPGPALLAA